VKHTTYARLLKPGMVFRDYSDYKPRTVVRVDVQQDLVIVHTDSRGAARRIVYGTQDRVMLDSES